MPDFAAFRQRYFQTEAVIGCDCISSELRKSQNLVMLRRIFLQAREPAQGVCEVVTR